VIHLGTDGWVRHPSGKYSCERCGDKQMRRMMAAERKTRKK
jgi:hypothetical protein